jgi:hypothetical protein
MGPYSSIAATAASQGLNPCRPDTRWGHDYIAGTADISMLKGRLRFGDGAARGAAAAPIARDASRCEGFDILPLLSAVF